MQTRSFMIFFFFFTVKRLRRLFFHLERDNGRGISMGDYLFLFRRLFRRKCRWKIEMNENLGLLIFWTVLAAFIPNESGSSMSYDSQLDTNKNCDAFRTSTKITRIGFPLEWPDIDHFSQLHCSQSSWASWFNFSYKIDTIDIPECHCCITWEY